MPPLVWLRPAGVGEEAASMVLLSYLSLIEKSLLDGARFCLDFGFLRHCGETRREGEEGSNPFENRSKIGSNGP